MRGTTLEVHVDIVSGVDANNCMASRPSCRIRDSYRDLFSRTICDGFALLLYHYLHIRASRYMLDKARATNISQAHLEHRSTRIPTRCTYY